MTSVELYEYKIDGLTRNYKQSAVLFSALSKARECGLVSTSTSNAIPIQSKTARPRSCDILSSRRHEQSRPVLDEAATYLQRLYVLYQMVPSRLQLQDLEHEFMSEYQNIMRHEYHNILGDVSKAMGQLEVLYGQKQGEQQEFVFMQDVASTDKLVVFGDIHGGFHTFFRHLLRLHLLGAIDLERFQVATHFKLVFLGDIVDYGNFGFDVLLMIVRLVANSCPGAVLVGRGNHESEELWRSYGFENEVRAKFEPEPASKLLSAFLDFFDTCHTALLLRSEPSKEMMWLAHGGFPMDLDLRYANGRVLGLTPEQAHSTKWSDFGSRSKKAASSRPVIVPKQITAFLKKHNISLIVRGHSDFYTNSYLYRLEPSVTDHSRHSMYEGIPVHKYASLTGPGEDRDSAHDGPVAKLRITDIGKDSSVYPVLTLTTATDAFKMLDYDSFAVFTSDDSKRPTFSTTAAIANQEVLLPLADLTLSALRGPRTKQKGGTTATSITPVLAGAERFSGQRAKLWKAILALSHRKQYN